MYILIHFICGYVWQTQSIRFLQKILPSDMLFTQELYKRSGHKILPGSFLGPEKSGMGYVRIALTHEEEVMRKALLDIKECYEDFTKRD